MITTSIKRSTLLLCILCTLWCPVLAAGNQSPFDLAFTNIECAPSGGPGGPLYAWFSLENRGTQISMTDTVTIYLSPEPEITISDYPIGNTKISFIRPGEILEKGLTCTIPTNIPAGTYYSGAVLNIKFGLIEDANEEDNTIIGNNVTINRVYK